MSDYEIRDGIIVSPGKFEGEPRYATTFWDTVLDGFADHDFYSGAGEFGGSIVLVTPDDVALYPELAGVYAVHLYERSDGFVCTQVLTKEQVDKAVVDYAAENFGFRRRLVFP